MGTEAAQLPLDNIDTASNMVDKLLQAAADTASDSAAPRAVDVRIQKSRVVPNGSMVGGAIVFSVSPADARKLRAADRSPELKAKINAVLGAFRLRTHLPSDLYKGRQALWSQHTDKLKAAVAAKKFLHYNPTYTGVTIEGENVELTLAPVPLPEPAQAAS